MNLNCLGVVKITVMNKSILENVNKMSLRVTNLILNRVKFRAINIKPKQNIQWWSRVQPTNDLIVMIFLSKVL